MNGWRLIADVGGTNVRFARSARSGELTHVRVGPAARYASFANALEDYLAQSGGLAGCASAAVAAAGPVDGGRVELTNLPWSISASEVSRSLGGAPVLLINDVEAVAAALPHLADGDAEAIGPVGRGARQRTMLAINVGTGFGAAAAVRVDDRWSTLASEAGHMVPGAVGPAELELLPQPATVEDLLSGHGVVDLYGRVRAAGGARPAGPIDAGGIFARVGTDPAAARTVQVFTGLLGRIAGDVALATGAWGGVYLCGSVAEGWCEVADRGEFRAHFERKGAMTRRMQRVFTSIIRRDNVALFGLAWLRSKPWRGEGKS